MLEVVSFSGYSDKIDGQNRLTGKEAVSVRRGGLVHGTKVATTVGWKRVEQLDVGDLVRTLDNGFQEIQRVSCDLIHVPEDETRSGFLPVLVPARAAYNGTAVWLMPEQGLALGQPWLDLETRGQAVVSARFLSGCFKFSSRSPAPEFEVTSLFFENDEVVYIEGGLKAFCPASRIRPLSGPRTRSYSVLDEEDAIALVSAIDEAADLSAVASPLGALPAPIPTEPIFPIRPSPGVRRPGRPGRPNMPVLLLRPEWQT